MYAEMLSPTEEEVYGYIEEIVRGVENIERRLANDVKDMCKPLSLLVDSCKKRAPNKEDIPQGLKQSFKDIYGSLKLHINFHLYELEVSELTALGNKIGLTEIELNAFSGPECAIDPGSKVLEIVSTI